MRKLLGEMLIEDGVINDEQLKDALKVQKEDGNLLGITLVKLGYIDSDTLLGYLKQQGTIIKIHKRQDGRQAI